jgi:hypothetical protein
MKPAKPMRPGIRKMGTDAIQRGGSARLTPEVQRKIGTQLRAMYDDVVKQGVPDRFTQLLSQVDERADKAKE